jgi:succinate dehydrogenase/fumarate reductase flavoprotein subunit
VLGIDQQGHSLVATATATVLATGGGGKVYLRTNNATGSTGDGYALAYRAGAVLRDMEFVQFYPTGWGDQPAKMFFYEGLLPIGAIIRNALGEDVLLKHGLTDYAKVTRDVLVRAIMAEIAAGRGIDGSLVFDLTAVPEERTSALRRAREMSQAGNLSRLPVAPTVHFFMGGVRVGAGTETGIDGLYAAGEVCGGLHGANRLGGNAISETLVFGMIAGERAAAEAAKALAPTVPETEVNIGLDRLQSLASGSCQENLGELELSLRRTMWLGVGAVRDASGLEASLSEIAGLQERLAAASLDAPGELFDAVKLENMLAVSEMICRAALLRTESRGAHYRSDFPEEDDSRWRKTIEIRHGHDGMQLAAAPVSGDAGG